MESSAPPNVNLENPEIEANYVNEAGQVVKPDITMDNTAAFGGENTAIIFRRHEKGNLTEV